MWQIYESKEYALTRGGLIDELVVTTNYEKSAEVIVLVKTRKDWTTRGIKLWKKLIMTKTVENQPD